MNAYLASKTAMCGICFHVRASKEQRGETQYNLPEFLTNSSNGLPRTLSGKLFAVRAGTIVMTITDTPFSQTAELRCQRSLYQNAPRSATENAPGGRGRYSSHPTCGIYPIELTMGEDLNPATITYPHSQPPCDEIKHVLPRKPYLSISTSPQNKNDIPKQ